MSEQLPEPDWISFLYHFGTEVGKIASSREEPLCAFLSIPFLNYASALIASGLLAAKYTSQSPPPADPHDWIIYMGESVSFPFELCDGGTELKRKVGVIEGVEIGPRGPRLAVTYLDDMCTNHRGRKFTRFVKPRWLSAIKKLDTVPDLETWQHGSRLASNIRALDSLLGEAGAAALVGKAQRDCLIVDVKSRIAEELKDSVELARLGMKHDSGSLVLADMIRPEGWGPDAMRETFSSHVAAEPESGWHNTIICGSLNLLKYWDDCDSKVRIGILCPSENAYEEAVAFVNEIYFQRIDALKVSEGLLAAKPSTVDFQLISCNR